MNRLEEQYGDQIEFVLLNVDDPGSLPMRQQYDIVARSQYVLVDANGAVVQKWFGYISEEDIARAFDEHLNRS